MADWVRQVEACKRLGLSRTALAEWAKRPGSEDHLRIRKGVTEYAWPSFPRWRDRELQRAADHPENLEEARARKLTAEAMMAEIELAQQRGTVVTVEAMERVVGELAERLRAVLINAPSTYALDLERAGVDAAVAEEVLRKIATDLTGALRGAADDCESDLPGAA